MTLFTFAACLLYAVFADIAGVPFEHAALLEILVVVASIAWAIS